MLKINMYFTVIESLYQDLTTSKSRVNANICQQSFISDIIIRIFFAQFIYLSFVIDLFKAKQLTTIDGYYQFMSVCKRAVVVYEPLNIEYRTNICHLHDKYTISNSLYI